jgi:hypothetical protein
MGTDQAIYCSDYATAKMAGVRLPAEQDLSLHHNGQIGVGCIQSPIQRAPEFFPRR